MVTKTPKPLRASTQWEHATILATHGGLNEFGLKQVHVSCNITCRDCYGFGHSIKKCPTGAKLDKLRLVGDIAKKSISRFR
jgi:hypothetical protein